MPVNDCYSPHTGEHIRTTSPAPWMGRASVAAPDYDPVASAAFWRGDAWEIVMAEAPVLPPHLITPGEFRDRFTAAELAGITGLAYSGAGDATAQVLLLKIATASSGIDLGSPGVAAGLDYLVAKGLMAVGRVSEILA